MLYEKYPPLDRVHTLQHICLEVPNVAGTESILARRTLPAGGKAPSAMKMGVNGKRQINYFDPDGTRIEVMEPGTFDGQVRAPAPAPAPMGERRAPARAQRASSMR
jgi:hypothetical protein